MNAGVIARRVCEGRSLGGEMLRFKVAEREREDSGILARMTKLAESLIGVQLRRGYWGQFGCTLSRRNSHCSP